jgi:stage II sporulation protein D
VQIFNGIILTCILTSALFALDSNASSPKIKVKIGKSLSSVTVNGLDLMKRLPTLNKTKQYQGRKSVRFNCISKRSSKGNLKSPILLASLSSSSGIIKWDKTFYKGDLRVITSDNKSCDLINEVGMEDYISTLLSREMNSKWPIEALKAQAIAARTYAISKINKNKNKEHHLESSERFQVSGSLFDETPKTAKASDKTKGLVLVSKKDNKTITPIFFHAKCGGRTLRPESVWTNKVNGYAEVDCPFCHKYGMKAWKKPVNKRKFRSVIDKILQKYYGENLKSASKYMMVPDKKLSRYLTVYKNGERKKIKKSQLRKILGRKILPSNNFEIQGKANQVIFDGEGYGHGVGLCQLGALELAKRGYSFKQILAHYFPGHVVKKIY